MSRFVGLSDPLKGDFVGSVHSLVELGDRLAVVVPAQLSTLVGLALVGSSANASSGHAAA